MHSLPLPTLILSHVLVAYMLLVSPVSSRRRTKKAEQEIDAGSPTARLKLYREVILSQFLIVAALAALVRLGGVPSSSVGLRAPYSWPVTLGCTLAAVGFMIWSGLRLRKIPAERRARLRERAKAMIPSTRLERAYFVLLSLGSGPAEEFLCRGFFFFYLRLWFPHMGVVAVVLLTSAAFGLAHLYQGWKGVMATGVGGALLAAAYEATGNLLFPTVLHSMGNLRVALLPIAASEESSVSSLTSPLALAQTRPTAHQS